MLLAWDSWSIFVTEWVHISVGDDGKKPFLFGRSFCDDRMFFLGVAGCYGSVGSDLRGERRRRGRQRAVAGMPGGVFASGVNRRCSCIDCECVLAY